MSLRLLRSACRQPHLPMSQTCSTRWVSAFPCLSPIQHDRGSMFADASASSHPGNSLRPCLFFSQTRHNVVVCLVSLMNRPSYPCVHLPTGRGRSLCTADDLPRRRRRLHSPSSCSEFTATPGATSTRSRANHLVLECAWRHVVGGTRKRALAVVWWWMERRARRSSCTRARRARCKCIAPASLRTESFSHAFSISIRVRPLSMVAPWTTNRRSSISVTIALRDVLLSAVANYPASVLWLRVHERSFHGASGATQSPVWALRHLAVQGQVVVANNGDTAELHPASTLHVRHFDHVCQPITQSSNDLTTDPLSDLDVSRARFPRIAQCHDCTVFQ